jgi:hypothetical protein
MDQGHGNKLDRLQEQAIACLLTEPTVQAAADKAGVGVATLGRWLQSRAFRAAYHAARRQVLAGTVQALVLASTDAVAVLAAELKGAKAGDRIRAAEKILGLALRAESLVNLDDRLSALEDDAEEDRRRRLGPHTEDPADE